MTRLSTASHSWQTVLMRDSYRRDLVLLDADRDDLGFGTKALRAAVAKTLNRGGLLVWNRTRDEEGGNLVMFTGQTCEQELQVLDNATWMVSTGAVYAASRVGMKGWKLRPDHRVTHDDDKLLVWLVPNDRDVEGMRR